MGCWLEEKLDVDVVGFIRALVLAVCSGRGVSDVMGAFTDSFAAKAPAMTIYGRK